MTRRGQSIGEYAVLIGLVIGAVLAMQNYIRARISGGIQNRADAYLTAVGGKALGLTRTEASESTADLKMTTATAGTSGASSKGTSFVTNP